MKRLQSYILFILLLLATALPAHEHISRNMFMLSNFNTDNGLFSSRVYSIVEAEDGAMWISTKRGIDGSPDKPRGSLYIHQLKSHVALKLMLISNREVLYYQ